MAIRMEGSPPNLVVWRELATGIEFHCNDFSVLPMPWGTSGYARFGLPCPPLTNAAVDRDEDYHEPITQLIQLDGLGLASSDQAIHERETLRELGELPRPNAGALDSIGRFVECTGDGDWVLTGKRIVDPSASPELKRLLGNDPDANVNIEKLVTDISENPTALLNTEVYRRFIKDGDHKLVGVPAGNDPDSRHGFIARGTITAIRYGKPNWFTILYDDGSKEDYSAEEVEEFGVRRACGSMSTQDPDELHPP